MQCVLCICGHHGPTKVDHQVQNTEGQEYSCKHITLFCNHGGSLNGKILIIIIIIKSILKSVLLCTGVYKYPLKSKRSTYAVLEILQMSGLIATTTATSCSPAVQGVVPVVIYLNAVTTIVVLVHAVPTVSLTSALFKGCLHTSIQSRTLPIKLLPHMHAQGVKYSVLLSLSL